MQQDSTQMWAQSTEQLQGVLNNGWVSAFQSFQNMDLGLAGPAAANPAAKLPSIQFAPEKLQQLQQQYLREAAGLWEQSLHGAAQAKDKRFEGKGWASNPLASFSAAAYLLN